MEILNLQQIIWQALNFLVLYFIIAKFIVPPTKKFIAQREEEIKSGLDNAEKVKQQLADAEKTREEILSKAKDEGKAIIEEMRAKSEEMSRKLMEEAQEKTQVEMKRLIAKAESDLESRRAKLDEEVIRLAKIVAEKSLSVSLTADMQHEILKKQLDSVKHVTVQT